MTEIFKTLVALLRQLFSGVMRALLKEIDKRSDFILSGNEVFTNLAKDYLEFIKEINLTNIPSSVVESQKFKKKIFEL